MPFGKFSGVEIADLPDSYVAWLHSIELREPLKSAVEAEFHARFARPASMPPPSSKTLKIAEEIVAVGYRKLAQTRHPDRGGDHAGMVTLNAAAAFLRQSIGSLP